MTTISPAGVGRLPTKRGYALAFQAQPGRLPWVVFLGGFRSDMEGTKAQYLASWCKTRDQAFLRFDYSGHGQSEGRFEAGSISLWTQDALDVLGVLSGEQCVLVGSSMGGWIMLRVALTLLDQVTGLVGIAAAPDFTRDLLLRDLSEAQREELRQAGSVHLSSAYDPEGFTLTTEFLEDGEKCCLLDQSISIECPVRLLQGVKDEEVPWETALKLSATLTGQDVSVQLLKDGDHRLSQPRQLALIGQTLEAMLGIKDKTQHA